MEVKEIIESLKYNNGKFPKTTILEARKNKNEITEELLKQLEEITNNVHHYANQENYFLPLYAMFLLAEFREKRAYPIIIKLIAQNQDDVDLLLGDLITDSLSKILASTYDGNIESLHSVITNLELNEFIRNAAFGTLEILQNYNIIEKEQVMEMIEKLLENELKDDDSYVITSIVMYIEENKLYDKIGIVRKLYDEERVSEFSIGGYDDFIDGIYGNKKTENEQNIIEDTIKELSWWACFKQEQDKEEFDFKEATKKLFEYENKKIEKEVQEKKQVGRNDPCPCRKREEV